VQRALAEFLLRQVAPEKEAAGAQPSGMETI
jgi:hypothetical protein